MTTAKFQHELVRSSISHISHPDVWWRGGGEEEIAAGVDLSEPS